MKTLSAAMRTRSACVLLYAAMLLGLLGLFAAAAHPNEPRALAPDPPAAGKSCCAKPSDKSCPCDLGPNARACCDCGDKCACDPCTCKSLAGIYQSRSEDAAGNVQWSAVVMSKTDFAGIYSVHGIDNKGQAIKGRGFRKGRAFTIVWIGDDQQAGVSVYEVHGCCGERLDGNWSFMRPDGPMLPDRLRRLGPVEDDEL